MIDHRDVWELLPDAAAGTSTPDELHDVEAHARVCPACREELAALRRAHELVSAAPLPVEPPSSLRERVLAIPERDYAPPAAAERPRRRFTLRWRALALAGAAAVCVALALAVVGTRGTTPSSASVALWPTTGGNAWGRAALGQVHDGNIPLTLNLQHLAPSRSSAYYEVWLCSDNGKRYSIGKLEVGDQGAATVQMTVPAGAVNEYNWVWVTRQASDDAPAPSNDIVLKGKLA
jgi:anti-sigma-K factor RskA